MFVRPSIIGYCNICFQGLNIVKNLSADFGATDNLRVDCMDIKYPCVPATADPLAKSPTADLKWEIRIGDFG